MPYLARPTAVLLPLALLAVGLIPRSAAAQQAGQPCTGTLCDLYYGNSSAGSAAPPAAGQKAAPTPLSLPGSGFLGRLFGGGSATPAAPSTGATAPGAPAAKPGLVQVQGGGLVGVMRGAPAQRCSGTLCDFYYGGPPPEEPEAQPQPAAIAPQPLPDAPDDAPAPARRGRAADETPRCAYSAADPWRCYR